MTKTVILYHVYGSTDLYNQVKFSILTLFHHLKGNFDDIKVVVYTDNPKYFDGYNKNIPLYIETLTKEKISSFKGDINFLHRVKICVIKDCFSKYRSNIFYLDSDTYFTNNPIPLLSKISAGTSIMNSNDYNLIEADDLYENNDWLSIRKAIKNFKYEIDGTNLQIPLTTRMWNAGVIGLSFENKHLLNNIIDLTEQIYKNKPVFTAEQFAFSYYLQNKTKLTSSEDVIFHYWRNFYGSYWKNSHNYHFDLFFNEIKGRSIQEKAAAAYKLTSNPANLMYMPAPSILEKIKKRLKLLKKVALTGKI